MVRLIPIEERGKIVWIEDAPTVCPRGHENQLTPSTGGCPVCGEPVRLWDCRAEGCREQLYDDEHVHDSRKR
jgi:hypothetical protein